jgi:protein-disulfide isomerase
VLAAFSFNTGPTGLQHGRRARSTLAVVQEELAGIPESGTTLGDPAARVTLTYYGDLECPVCAELTTTLLPRFIRSEVRTERAKLVYRSFCTATCTDEGPATFDTQQADAYAAGMQDRFWYYAELFYREQGPEGSGYATSSFFRAIARQVPGLDLSRWQRDTRDPSLLARVRADNVAATRARYGGTPTLIVSGPRGRRSLGSGLPASYSVLSQGVRAVS